ncbi:hypothetical protein PSHT_16245 [Puccinia striiformis]|uniref:Uncharacterized protein n=1 Tax=Puccinia striiformis TaxID=27350 RepID=A0A2S4UAR0_9BASI|nr:hypothetical protein PSHT_16245 [Puccinia striiformis]
MQPFNFNSDKSLLGSGCPPNNYTPSLKQTSSYIQIRPIKALPRREDQPTQSGVQSSDLKPTINQQFVIDWSSFRPNSDLDLPPLILGRYATVSTRDTRTSNPTLSNLQPASKSRAQQQVIPQQQFSSQDCNSGRSHLGFFKLKTYDGEWPADTWLIPSMRTTLPGIEEEKSTSEANYQSSSPNLRADINFPEIPEIESDLDVNENFPVLCSALDFIPEPLNRSVEDDLREQVYDTQTDGMPDEQGGSFGWAIDQEVGLREEMMQSGRTYELRRKSSLNHSDDERAFQKVDAPVYLTKQRRIG